MGLFSKDIDHSRYFVPNFEELTEAPGFPYIRINKEIQNKENSLPFDKEHLLIALHGKSADILILSNKKIAVYKIPAKKSFFKKAIGVALDQVPGVSDVMDGLDNAMSLKGEVKNIKGWVTGANKREAARREAEGLPSKKDFKNVIWNIPDPDAFGMILSYRDDILLCNGFGWNTEFEASLEDNAITPTEITLKQDGIYLKAGKKKASINFLKTDYDFYTNINVFAKEHKRNFNATNWQF